MSNLRLLDPAFDDNFEKALRSLFSPRTIEPELPALKMRLDVSENDAAFTVKADIPGVKKEDLDVRIEGNQVKIDARKESESQSRGNDDKLLRSERHYGHISRSFSLGQDVDEAQVQAKYTDGVLTLLLPKKSPATTSKIQIQ